MLLQGDLQKVFDALYHLGVIDPVLDLDWAEELEGARRHRKELDRAVTIVNSYQTDEDTMMQELGQFDDKVLNYLAMEVAREFADFHAREELH